MFEKHPLVRDDEEDDQPGEVRDILLYPDGKDILQSECDPVEEVTDEVRSLVDDLVATMRTYQGIGLSAPQIGVQKRVAVAEDPQGEAHVLINPDILDEHGEMTTEEGCLSIPGMTVEVTRPQKVRIQTLTLEGDEEELVKEGHESVVLQHEIDHLDGVLMFEYAEGLDRRMAMKKYKKLRKAATREGFDLLEARRG